MSYPQEAKPKRNLRYYTMGECVGNGNFTDVYMCTEKSTGKVFAIKEVNKEKVEKVKKQADIVMEKHILTRTRHVNVIQCHHTFRDGVNVYLVYDFCTGGDLWKEIWRSGIPDAACRHYFMQLLNVMEYLRTTGIVHRDVKAENIMVHQEGRWPCILKLIDFGTAKDLRNPQIRGSGNECYRKTFYDYVGTPNFMAPEIIRNKFSDHRADVYSLGCTFFQCMTGLPPFPARGEFLTYIRAMNNDLRFPPGCVSPEGEDLIRKMVVKDPNARLGVTSLEDVKRHPYFEKFGCDQAAFLEAHTRNKPVLGLQDCCLRVLAKRLKPYYDEEEEWLITEADALRSEWSDYIRNHLSRIVDWNRRMEAKLHPGPQDEEDHDDLALVEQLQSGKGLDDSDDELLNTAATTETD